MRPLDALTQFRRLLSEGGIEFEEEERELLCGRGEDWRRVWELFCALALEPADEPFERAGIELHVGDGRDYDLLLHESGAYSIPFGVDFRRQFSFEDEQGDYGGMNAFSVNFECARAPEGRVPQAQRWGYAGRRRGDAGDESHPEMRNWAGWVESWKRAVEASNSFKVLDEIQPVRWSAFQSDI